METGEVISVKLLIFNILFFILFMYAKKSTKKLGFFLTPSFMQRVGCFCIWYGFTPPYPFRLSCLIARLLF